MIGINSQAATNIVKVAGFRENLRIRVADCIAYKREIQETVRFSGIRGDEGEAT